MTPAQRKAVERVIDRLDREKQDLVRLVDATDDGDLDDGAQSVEDAIECLHAALDNDEEWKK